MGKLTLDDLRKLRDEKKAELSKRDTEGATTQVIIGMGTCGIAAGAKDVFSAFLDEIDKQKMDGVLVTQTGCMGLCHSEPTVEVKTPDMPTVIYGNVDADIARRIVTEHLGQQKLIDEHIFDKPAKDILT